MPPPPRKKRGHCVSWLHHPSPCSHSSNGLHTNPSNYSWINSHPWITSGCSPLPRPPGVLATPPPIHQSCQGRAEQAHKPTHLGWVLKTQAGARHPSSTASFGTDVFGLLSSPPADLISEARPRAVPQGLPKSPLRPAPGWAAAPAFPAAVEVGERRGRWPRTLSLGHRGRLCPSPWPLGSASDPPSRAHPPAESQPVELSRASGRAAWPAACSGRFPSSWLWSRSLLPSVAAPGSSGRDCRRGEPARSLQAAEILQGEVRELLLVCSVSSAHRLLQGPRVALCSSPLLENF